MAPSPKRLVMLAVLAAHVRPAASSRLPLRAHLRQRRLAWLPRPPGPRELGRALSDSLLRGWVERATDRDVVVWRGIELSGAMLPEGMLDELDEASDSLEATGKLPPIIRIVDDDDDDDVDEDEGAEADRRESDASARIRELCDAAERDAARRARARRVSRLALGALAALAASCALHAVGARATAQAASRAAPLVLVAGERARAVLHAALAPALLAGCLWRRDIWLREPRDAIPLMLADALLVQAAGSLLCAALGARALACAAVATAAAPPSGAAVAGALGGGGAAAAAAARSASAQLVLVLALRELLTLSALCWWLDLADDAAAAARGRVGRLFGAWRGAAGALAVLGLAQCAAGALAVSRGGVWAGLARAPPARLGARLAHPLLGPALSACSFGSAAYACCADLVAVGGCDWRRRCFRPTLDSGARRGRGRVYAWAARTPGARLLARLRLRPAATHYAATAAGSLPLHSAVGWGASQPDLLRPFDPRDRPAVYGVTAELEEEEEEEEWAEEAWAEHAAPDADAAPPDDASAAAADAERARRRRRRAARVRSARAQDSAVTEQADSPGADGVVPLPILQALDERFGGDDEPAEPQSERARRRFSRTHWGAPGPDGSAVDLRRRAEAWAARAEAEGPPRGFELSGLEQVGDSGDLRAPQQAARTVIAAEGAAPPGAPPPPPAAAPPAASASAAAAAAAATAEAEAEAELGELPLEKPGVLEEYVARFLEADRF